VDTGADESLDAFDMWDVQRARPVRSSSPTSEMEIMTMRDSKSWETLRVDFDTLTTNHSQANSQRRPRVYKDDQFEASQLEASQLEAACLASLETFITDGEARHRLP